jgi:uncharacterized membrane protein YfcA
MQEILGYVLAVIIGISLGLIGGGGSILTVPVLVYLLHVDPVLATTYSLFIVGFTSLVGGVKAYIKKLVDFKAVSLFGIPSILTIFVARHFILPAIPEHILTIGGFELKRGGLLMIIFALLMLAAAISMMYNRVGKLANGQNAARQDKTFSLLVPGLLVGLVTGLLGAGSGFLIIPALVLLIKLPMKTAVGTSLLIIAINSTFGFVFSIGHYNLHWPLLFLFTGLSVAGVFIGAKLSEKIDGESLKKGFGWFVLVMSLYILAKEIFFH